MGFFSSLVGGVVGFFIGGPVGAVIGAGLGATKVGEKVVNAVLDFVTQPFLGSLGTLDAPGESQRQQGVMIQTQGSVKAIPVVYGYRKIAGTVVFAETGSTNNKYLYVAYVFCEGVVEGLREVYIDDWQLPANQVGDLNANKLVTVASDRYKDRVQLQFSQGVYLTDLSQNVNGNIIKNGIFADAPSFKNTMNFNGLCCVVARYEWKDIKTQADSDANPFNGNIPDLQIGILGKRVASLLTDNTEIAEYDSNEVRYSTNPAECLLDYLRNPRYGKGLKNSDIDWATWKIAARKCNQTVTYVASGIQGPILTLNYVLDTEQTIMSNVKTLLQNFRAYMPYVQGKYKLRIEDAGNETDILSGSALIVATFTKDDIVSDVTFNGIDKSSKYNVVSVTYVDPDQKFSNQTVVYPETEEERQRYITLDNGRENKYDITFGGITNYAIAKDMARLMFNKSRNQDSVSITVTSRGLEIEPGDNIRIQSNILNFGVDPWRVVSVRINNDMTVSLGCVRNPDYIYPYVRVGEEDVVLPTYVPKGSVIYYPSSFNPLPLGLVPPTKAVSTVTGSGTATVFPSTNTQGNGGGGVGGGGTDSAAVGTVTVIVSDANVTPKNPTAPPPFSALLIYKRATAPKLPSGTFLWDLFFTQPSDALYDYSILYFRYNRYSSWREIRIESKPGPGGEIAVNIGELTQVGRYEWFTRSFATDGRGSTKMLKGTLELTYGSVPGTLVPLVASEVIESSGWSLPASQAPAAPVYDTSIDYFYLRPVLENGLPLANRKIRYGIQVYQETYSRYVNNLVSGFAIYYRAKGEEYWEYEKFKFSAGYYNGQMVEGQLAGDFGPRIHPLGNLLGGGGSFAGPIRDLQTYEFLVRLIYEDGKPAETQLGPRATLIEFNAAFAVAGNGFDAYLFGRKTVSIGLEGIPNGLDTPMTPVTADFNTTFKTIDQLAQGAVDSASLIVPNINQIFVFRQEPKMIWRFIKPPSTKFRGFKIRFREIQAGSNPDFTELTTQIVPNEAGVGGELAFEWSHANFQFNKNYEFVVTAQVKVGAAVVDATNSLFSKVRVLFEDPEQNNLVAKFNFEQQTTVEALKLLKTAFAASDVVNIKHWNKIALRGGQTTYDVEQFGADYPGYSYFVRLNQWYQLRFQLPARAAALVCYRRKFDLLGAQLSSVGSFAKYKGLGPWEKVRVPKAELALDAEGWYTANFRGPIGDNYFSYYYETARFPTATLLSGEIDNQTYVPLFPSNGKVFFQSQRISNIRPYALESDINAFDFNNTIWHQYLFVIEDTFGTLDNRGLLLKNFRTDMSAEGFKPVRIGLGEGNVNPLVVEDINTTFNTAFQANYGRRLSEALTSTDLANLEFKTAVGAQVPSFTPGNGQAGAPFQTFLLKPKDGTKIY